MPLPRLGAGAAAGVQAERGAVRAAAARGAIPIRHAPHGGRVRACLDPACVRDRRSYAVRVQRVRRRPGRLGGVARGAQEDRRSGGAHAPRGVGAARHRPGGDAVLDAARVPGGGRRPVYPDRRAGDLGRAAAVAGVRRRVRRDRRDRDRVHLRSGRSRGGSPRRWSRSACSSSTRPGSARRWASRPPRVPMRCCRRPTARRSSIRASTITSRRTSRSCRSCSWAGSRSRCSAYSAWRRHFTGWRGTCRPRRERRLAASHGRCRPGRMRSGGILDRVRAGRDREAGRGWRVGDPGAALRGQRSDGTCHPGMHVLVRVPGVRPPSVQLLSARPGRGVQAGGRRDRGPARRASAPGRWPA